MSNELLNVLYRGTLKSIENTILAYAQTNDYTNTITNYLASNNIFKETDELIGFKTPNSDKINFTHKRMYVPQHDEELSEYSQLIFDSGKLVGVRDSGGQVAGLTHMSTTGKELFGAKTEFMGGLAAITGGVFPGHIGDVRKYEPYMEDRAHIKRDAMGVAFDYYREKAVPLAGQQGNGIEWYVAKVPRTDTPLEVFDPREYDLGLVNKFWGTGTAYYLLEPLFHIPKNAIMKFSERERAATTQEGKPIKATAVLDPVIDMQANMAKKVQRAAGGVIAPAYPLLFLARPFLEILEKYMADPIYQNVDALFSAAEGLFDPLPPQPRQKGRGRTMSDEARFKKVFSDGGLSEAGNVIDGREMFRVKRRVA